MHLAEHGGVCGDAMATHIYLETAPTNTISWRKRPWRSFHTNILFADIVLPARSAASISATLGAADSVQSPSGSALTTGLVPSMSINGAQVTLGERKTMILSSVSAADASLRLFSPHSNPSRVFTPIYKHNTSKHSQAFHKYINLANPYDVVG